MIIKSIEVYCHDDRYREFKTIIDGQLIRTQIKKFNIKDKTIIQDMLKCSIMSEIDIEIIDK